MGKTAIEKLIEKRLGREVCIGEFIEVTPDIVFANDITAPLGIDAFCKIKSGQEIKEKEKIIFFLDHFLPSKDIPSASLAKKVRDFAKKEGIRIKELHDGGIEHAVLQEERMILPSSIVCGADSHTTTHGAVGAYAFPIGSTDLAYFMLKGKVWTIVPKTFKVYIEGELPQFVDGKDAALFLLSKIQDDAVGCCIEFSCPSFCMEDRFTLCNMAAEASAQCAYIDVDEITKRFFGRTNIDAPSSDDDAEFLKEISLNAETLVPFVSSPPSPKNVLPASECNVFINQAFLGSCTNGWLKDLRIAARILNGRKVHKDVRLLVAPATTSIYKKAIKEGIIDVFLDAGAVILPPSCGPCLGGHLGVLAEGEVCIASTNRNFLGRMGHKESSVYLASAATVAASAVMGRVTDPRLLS